VQRLRRMAKRKFQIGEAEHGGLLGRNAGLG